MDNYFSEDDNSRVLLAIDELTSKNNLFYHQLYLIRFSNKDPGIWQTGFYNFFFEPLINNEEKLVKIILTTDNKPVELNNIKVKLFIHK
jgi:hypothetical protein